MEKPTPTTQNITLSIVHPEKERFELCEIECGAATTLDELKDQICAKTGLQARILVMAKRYEAGGDLDEAQRAALRAQAYVNWVRAGAEIKSVDELRLLDGVEVPRRRRDVVVDGVETLRPRADASMIDHQQDTGIWHAHVMTTLQTRTRPETRLAPQTPSHTSRHEGHGWFPHRCPRSRATRWAASVIGTATSARSLI